MIDIIIRENQMKTSLTLAFSLLLITGLYNFADAAENKSIESIANDTDTDDNSDAIPAQPGWDKMVEG